MKKFVHQVFSVLLAAASVSGGAGCSRAPLGGDGPGAVDGYRLVLDVRSLDAGLPSSGGDGVTEKIKTLRVIVLEDKEDGKEDGKIECNRLIEIGASAAAFRYEFVLPTTAGTKAVYLIANEESVGAIQGAFPAGLPTASLTELAESFGVGTGAASFRQAMEAVYFAPDYAPDPEDGIYLPYVSCYDGIEMIKDQVTTQTMYLVPVATKFTFHFVNKRAFGISVKQIGVTAVDSDNFLFARVGAQDYRKEFDDPEKPLYWIDWLAAVAAKTQEAGYFGTNESVNEKYGWISDYAMPAPGPEERTLLAESILVPAAQGEIPGEAVCGPCYFPESRNIFDIFDKDGNPIGEEQRYFLSLELEDKNPEASPADIPKFEKQQIENLKSLFRNTSVLIRITMSQDAVKAYAEIADWSRKSANGWVLDGEDSESISE